MGPYRVYGALKSPVTSEANLGHSQKNLNVKKTSLIDCIKSNPCIDLDRPLGTMEVEALRISRQSAHEGGKVVSPTHRPPLSHLVLRPEGLSQ